jgi:diguanylate cyclase
MIAIAAQNIPQQKKMYVQNRRLGVLRASAISYALDTFWLLLFAWQKVVDFRIPACYGLATALGVGLFFIFIRLDLNLKLRDPDMTMEQTAFGYFLQLVFLVLAPQLAILFFLTMFIVAGFGALTMTNQQFIMSWFFIGISSAWVIFSVGNHFSFPTFGSVQLLLLWFAFISTIARVFVVSLMIHDLRKKLHSRNQELKSSLEHIEHLARYDSLTQIFNRRTVLELIEEEILRSKRTKDAFCVALLDIDHFKSVNDRFGHAVGDQVLQAFATTASNAIRVTDRIGRYGGEEFVILMPYTNLEGAMIAMDRLCKTVSEMEWASIQSGFQVTVSIGVAQVEQGEMAGQILHRSDGALYNAKHAGRNQTAAHKGV